MGAHLKTPDGSAFPRTQREHGILRIRRKRGEPPKGRYGEFVMSIVGQENVKEKYRFGLKEEKNWNNSLLDDRKRVP